MGARRIKGRMSLAKRRKTFENHLDVPCAGKRGWPKFMAIVEEGGKDKYVDVHATAEAKQKVAFKQVGAEVKSNALDACRYFVQGHRKLLLEALEASKEVRASEVNFHRLVCRRKGVCQEADLEGRGSDEGVDSEDQGDDL